MIMDTEKGRRKYVNDMVINMYGASREKLKVWLETDQRSSWILKNNEGVILAKDQMPIFLAVKQGKLIREKEIQLVREDGEVRQLLITALPLKNAEGRIFASVSFYSDITQLRKVQLQVVESRQQFQVLSRYSHDVVFRFQLPEKKWTGSARYWRC